jgi:hypothetical protein
LIVEAASPAFVICAHPASSIRQLRHHDAFGQHRNGTCNGHYRVPHYLSLHGVIEMCIQYHSYLPLVYRS